MNTIQVSPATSPQNTKPKLLDQMRYVLRKLHYQKRTEEPRDLARSICPTPWPRNIRTRQNRSADCDGRSSETRVSITQIYTHVLNRGGQGVISPADVLT